MPSSRLSVNVKVFLKSIKCVWGTFNTIGMWESTVYVQTDGARPPEWLHSTVKVTNGVDWIIQAWIWSGIYRHVLVGSYDAGKGQHNTYIWCESKRSWAWWRGAIKQRCRQNNHREYGEDGPFQSIHCHLRQDSPLGSFFQERWPTFTSIIAHFFHILNITTVCWRNLGQLQSIGRYYVCKN